MSAAADQFSGLPFEVSRTHSASVVQIELAVHGCDANCLRNVHTRPWKVKVRQGTTPRAAPSPIFPNASGDARTEQRDSDLQVIFPFPPCARPTAVRRL